MQNHIGLLSTAKEIDELSKVLKNHRTIAFDTEFIRESTFFPVVEIIQIATDTESWLIDAQAFKRGYPANQPDAYDTGLKPLLDIFTDKSILKIVHAAQGDQECLFTSFGVVATPTLDTAVAASLCGYGDGMGLGRLLKVVLDVTLTKGHARTNWSVRPLPTQLESYAHADVHYLVELGQTLLNELEGKGRKDWALELSAKYENLKLYNTDVDAMTHKLGRSGRLNPKEWATLAKLVKWREDRVRQLNLPRRWLADDHVLVDLARVRPRDVSHLSTFRGLNKGEIKNSADTLLKILSEDPVPVAPASPAAEKTPRLRPPTESENQAMDLLKVYIGILADHHKIAARHLMTSEHLVTLIRACPADSDSLAELGVLTQEASRLIGDELIAILHGKRALSIQNNKIVINRIE